MEQEYQQQKMAFSPDKSVELEQANVEPKAIMTDTEERVYKAIRDQFRPLTYEDMKQIPRLCRIRSFDRHVRKLVKKKRLRKIKSKPPKFEVRR